MAYKLKEKFVFYYINQLFNFDFSKKPQISTTGPLSVLIPFASLSSIAGLSVLALVNIPIYSI